MQNLPIRAQFACPPPVGKQPRCVGPFTIFISVKGYLFETHLEHIPRASCAAQVSKEAH